MTTSPNSSPMLLRALVRAILLALVFAAAAQAQKIPVDDDPTMGERTAPVVLIEVADFQ